MSFDFLNTGSPAAKIKVIGIGGGGTNAVSTMIREKIEGVEFIAVNTDMQSLQTSLAPNKIQIGKELTKGLGAGSDPSVGRDAALEDRHEIQEALAGADMVFITAGMGGGTGTGGASVLAQIARDLGALTVAVVTRPFLFEGKRRRTHAEIGIERLRENVDTLIVIPNERLLEIATPDLSLIGAFKLADNVLVNAVRGISDIINIPGTINVDFADVKTIMSSTGQALMGIGYASGKNRATEAAHQAISSPLLDDINIEGASGILINITAGENISLLEVNEACTIIQDSAHEDANIIFGAVIDPQMTDEIRVTVIATGFETQEKTTFTKFPLKSRYADQDEYKIKSPAKTIHQQATSYEERALPSQNKQQLDDRINDNKNYNFPFPQAKTDSNMTVSTLTDTATLDPIAAHDETEHISSEMIPQSQTDVIAFHDTDSIRMDIERKIDEALDLAERVSMNESLDNLDVPSFLRKEDHLPL
jgi:cell division protein FtsZ